MASRQLDDKKPHRKAKPRSRPANPIAAAIRSWITVYLPPLESEAQNLRNESLVNSAPKRFTIYEPLALLPTGSFTSETWASILGVCGEAACNSLWQSILQEISKTGQGVVTHLAVNEGIPLHKAGEEDENVRRSPSGLRMLFGDFGPSEGVGEHPTKSDFEDAFWVGTKQNGILQTWGPRWTMFSRGNVKEKARLLGFRRPSLTRGTEEEQGESWAVDLYAGIGYFVFSYAALGMRVLCWEINPWSVEGLRRGALANKWSVKVIEGDDLQLPVNQLLAGGERIIVFLESNEKALERIGEIQETGLARNIEHVNCGFLPTSEPVWKSAWEVTKFAPEAWLHLHENVGVEDIESRRGSIQGAFETWAAASGASSRTPKVEHVEQVKTFAPGVWHCVFDVCITGRSSISNNGT